MKKIPKQAYTAEFKELAVKGVRDGESITAVVKELGLGDQTLRNWIKAAAEGRRKGAGSKVVTPEAMELSRLRAEVPAEAGERNNRKSSGALREGCSVKHAWMAAQDKAYAFRNERCSRRKHQRLRAWKRGGTPDR